MQVDEELIHRQVELVGCVFDDAQVGLMGDDEVEVGGVMPALAVIFWMLVMSLRVANLKICRPFMRMYISRLSTTSCEMVCGCHPLGTIR